MREYYDLWEHFTRGLGRRGRLKESVRRKVFHAIDHHLLTKNVTRLLAQSRTIQERLQRFGGIPSELLYPPAPDRAYRTDEYGDYLFAVSRLTPLKRLGLLVEAVALMRDRFLAVKIAGEGEEADRLLARIAELGLGGRVELLGAVSDDDLVSHYARCRGVYFAPWSEDYGFVTLESFRSGKAVVTAADSGGPAELVRHEVNGLVAQPTPQAMADQLDRLADRALAERLGQAAEVAAREHTWERAVRMLAYNDLRAI
jgi:glycosyltransferase involved in cell wall biosynthesis